MGSGQPRAGTVPELVRIQGFLPPCPTARATTEVEVSFPDEGVLRLDRPALAARSLPGRLRQRPDPRCRFRAVLNPSGPVDVPVIVTTWLPPRRCTVRFYTEGTVPRIARSLPCQGLRRNLTVQLPAMPLALPLVDSEN